MALDFMYIFPKVKVLRYIEKKDLSILKLEFAFRNYKTWKLIYHKKLDYHHFVCRAANMMVRWRSSEIFESNWIEISPNNRVAVVRVTVERIGRFVRTDVGVCITGSEGASTGSVHGTTSGRTLFITSSLRM